MTDYIKRTDAVKIAEKYGLANGSVLGRHTGLADCIASEISGLPAADVAEVVQGSGKVRATKEAETTQIIDGCCTACGELMDCIEAAEYKFCPYCGKRIV